MAFIEFTESDFKACKYKVFKQETPLFELHPELKLIYAEAAAICDDMGWKEWFKAEQLMAYVVCCYHKPSPVIARVPELRERKIQALMVSGIDVGAWQMVTEAKPILAAILLGRHEFTTRLALHFLKSENNMLWGEYCKVLDYLEDAEFEMMNEGAAGKLTPVEIAGKKAAVYKGIQQYRSDLNILAEKLMQQDLDLQSYVQSHLVQAKRIRLITPEDVARLSEDELIEAFKQQRVLPAQS